MLNIKNQKNYFMGTSLFTDEATKYEYTTEIGSEFYDTAGGLKELPESKKAIKSKILKYDSISLNMTNVKGE